MANRKKIYIDLGNYIIKAQDKQGNRIYFESRFEKVKISEQSMISDSSCVVFDNKKYLMESGAFELENNKAQKESNFINLITAIGSLVDEDDYEVDVTILIPIEQYEKQKETYKEFLELKAKDKVEMTLYGEHKEFSIVNIDVEPEAMGVFFYLTPDFLKRRGNNPLIIVDIGGKTTDCCLIDERNIIRRPKTFDYGMTTVYREIMKSLNYKYQDKGLRLKLEDVRRVLTNGLVILGEKIDLRFVEDYFDEFANEIFTDFKEEYPEYKYASVVVYGGGVDDLKGEFAKSMPHAEFITDIFGNVEGLRRRDELLEKASKKKK